MKKLFIVIALFLVLAACTDYSQVCGRCDGRGYIFFDNNHHRETCPACGGSGVVGKEYDI